MELCLQGQAVVVVGGASGIGLAIAREFAGERCRVAIIDKNPRSAKEASTLCDGGLGLVADVTDYEAVLTAAGEVQAQLGGVQHLVFAAGMGSGKFGFPFWNLAPGDWDAVYRVNLLGAVHAAHAFAANFVEQRRGTLLFIASVAGQIGSQSDPPYSAAKAGLMNFAICAAKDFAPFGVRVNTLCPGMVQTPLNRGVWQAWNDRQPAEKQISYEEWGTAKVRQMCPLGQWQSPEQVAALAVYLASERAASITGQTLNVDGGWVMHW